MDCAKGCGAIPNAVPSMEMACEAAPSRRDMVTLTWEDDELPGQSIFNAKRVEITNEVEFFWLVSPGADVPLKYETLPRSREALPDPWLRINAPEAAGKIVMLGAAVAAATGVTARGTGACPNTARFASRAHSHIPIRAVC